MKTLDLTLLFADICNSTQLYETLGDQTAKEIILNRLQSIEAIANQHNGLVVKTIGDELLIRFDSQQEAVGAACDMQSSARKQFQLEDERHKRLEIRIALHHGPTILDANDVFGDAVNTAARIASLSKPSQILTSKETYELLPPLLQDKCRHIDRANIRGKAEDIDIYEIFDVEDDVTKMTAGVSRLAERPITLSLQYNQHNYIVDARQSRFTIGRSELCDLMINDDLVSRQHLTFEHRRGKIFILEQSTNGTWLKHENGHEIFLRREEVQLPLTGDLSFGQSFRENPEHIMYFEVVQE